MGVNQHDPLYVNEQDIPFTRTFYIQRPNKRYLLQNMTKGHSFRISAATSASKAGGNWTVMFAISGCLNDL